MPWVPLLLLEDQSPPIPPSSISITSLPTTDNDGNYTLQWTVTGLASSSWIIHEDSNTDFTSPTTYFSYDNTFPFTYSFTDKSSGTYCYRVGFASGIFSNPACVNVNIPVETRQVTINNQILSGLNLQQVVQVKVSGTNSFSRSDLLTDDPAQCLNLPGEAINRGDSRTFDITVGQNYYLFIGIGIWDLDNFLCQYTHPWFKRRFFTDPSYYTYYVYTIVSVSGHEGGNWDWAISGSYLNGTLVVTPSGNDPIDFTVTQSNPIP